jgi:hypothetical protein
MAHRKVPARGTTKGKEGKPGKKESTVDYLARLERYVGEHESLARSKKAVAKKKATAGIKDYGTRKGQSKAPDLRGGKTKAEARQRAASTRVQGSPNPQKKQGESAADYKKRMG